MPNVNVEPIVVRQDASRRALNALIRDLRRWQKQQTLFVISADMAHHQNGSRAMQRDNKTLALLRDGKAQHLRSMSSLYTDSGESLYIWLKLLDTTRTKMRVLSHTNSSRLLKKPHIEVTSYISNVFYAPKE
jgi:AmmeMemoRadiSam system protein B